MLYPVSMYLGVNLKNDKRIESPYGRPKGTFVITCSLLS